MQVSGAVVLAVGGLEAMLICNRGSWGERSKPCG